MEELISEIQEAIDCMIETRTGPTKEQLGKWIDRIFEEKKKKFTPRSSPYDLSQKRISNE